MHECEGVHFKLVGPPHHRDVSESGALSVDSIRLS